MSDFLLGRAIERWASESWANRGWYPTEAQVQALLPALRSTEAGQVLMRLLDHESIEALRAVAEHRGDTSLLELGRAQGAFEAFQRVMQWLLMERDEDLTEEILTQLEDDDDG